MVRKKMLTITKAGRNKKMPKTVQIGGRRFKVDKKMWKFVQKIEKRELKKK